MLKRKKDSVDFIKFLGTAGARFVMIKQLRASGGLWINAAGVNILVDPGPGSIVRCAKCKPKLNPALLDAIILTHKHLDHSNDINVMIEAMTEGGFKKRGVVFCPSDAVNVDSVIFNYAKQLPEKIEILKPLSRYNLKGFEFETSMRHQHPAETFGVKFKIKNTRIALLADTKYFKELTDFYKTDILIIGVVFKLARPEVEHLCFSEAESIIRDIKPKKAILTHFGMTMLAAKPKILAEDLTQRLGIEVLAAYDGMNINL